jgi:zinc protease
MNFRFTPLRWLGLLTLTLVLVLIFRSPAIAQTPRHYTDLTYPPLANIKIPEYERFTLKNGMTVYLMEDRQLPLVQGTALLRTGSRFEPADKVGLARMTGTVLRSGGTSKYSPQALNQLLEQRAAAIESGIDMTSGQVNFNTLSEDLETVFDLFAQVIQDPAFDPDQIELTKTQMTGAIARRNDRPGDIASRELRKVIYGQASPYARTEEYSTLANISRQDIIDFYRTYVRPEGVILGIVGDFDKAEMKKLVEQKFDQWQVKTPKPNLNLPSPPKIGSSSVYIVDQPQLTQSNILMGHLGGLLDSPDYPALSVVNGVMNGFGGRLFNDLRSRQGLAYTVYGVWSPSYDYPGLFVAGGQTRTETTVPFVKSLLAEVEKLRSAPISEEELTYAKDSILNAFVFKFENPAQTLSRLISYDYYGYPSDFIFQYQDGVKKTTIADIQRVANEYLYPNRMMTLIVGNEKQIQPTLGSLGQEIQTVDIAIPQPKTS